MNRNAKILLIAGAAGVGLWWWLTQGSGNASLAAHMPPAPIPTPALPAAQVTPPAVSTSGGNPAISPPQTTSNATGQMTTALLAWAQTTKNPALYAQMINQASTSDLAGLYNLLTTYWAGTTAAPTSAQTAFWNSLRVEYPFLNTGGVGCSNLACN